MGIVSAGWERKVKSWMINVGIVVGNITKRAGTERAAINLANMLHASGKYHVWIISMHSDGTDEPGYSVLKGVDVVHLNLSASNRFLAYVKFVRLAGKMIAREDLKLVMGTTHATNCLLGFVRKKTKVAACEHMNYGACPKYSRMIRRKVYPKLNAVVLLTKGDASNYTFVAPEKIYVIPNSLSFDNETPAELDHKRILSVGRLTAQKWFQKLLEAALEIKEKLPDWKIDIFGEGEEKEDLLRIIKENNLDGYVHIHEPVKNIKEQYMKSDMLAVTSRWEGFPMVILEAEACGLPVVSFDCDYGPGDLIKHGGNGYLVPVGDAHAFAGRVVEIALNKEKRKGMGRMSFENAQKYRESEVFRLWDRMLNEVVEQRV